MDQREENGFTRIPESADLLTLARELNRLGVRVNDDITVDLMTEACGVSYEDAVEGIEPVDVDGVRIPFASAALMLRLKQGQRDKDVSDRKFLEALLRAGPHSEHGPR